MNIYDAAMPPRYGNIIYAIIAITFIGCSGNNASICEMQNSIGIRLIYIKPGSFVMGSNIGEEGRNNDETQRHVSFEHGFFMSETEVTQQQWELIMKTNIIEQASKEGAKVVFGKGEKYPIYFVSWTEATEFCKKLSVIEGRKYRLPKETEWEYACRAGTKTPFCLGLTISTQEANYNGETIYGNGKYGVFRKKTEPVATFKNNGHGLYDMHGNVFEWCEDEFADKFGLGEGEKRRVIRGGSWASSACDCRSACRRGEKENARGANCGFRIVMEVELPRPDMKTPSSKPPSE